MMHLSIEVKMPWTRRISAKACDIILNAWPFPPPPVYSVLVPDYVSGQFRIPDGIIPAINDPELRLETDYA